MNNENDDEKIIENGDGNTWHPSNWISPIPRYWAYSNLFQKKISDYLYGSTHEKAVRVGNEMSFTEQFPYFWSTDPTEIVHTHSLNTKLYLGSAKNAADLDSLLRLDIKLIINVTSDIPCFYENHKDTFEYIQIPLLDYKNSSLYTVKEQFLSAIDKIRESNGNVLVHCFMGASRSVSLVCKYLMTTFDIKIDDAYDIIKSHRTLACMNQNFYNELTDL